MKRKFLIFLISFISIICLAFGFAACAPVSGGNGKGQEWTIERAYNTAKELGYDGSLEEFLETVKGKDGVSITDVYVDDNGHIIVVLSDKREIDCGKIVYVEACEHNYSAWQVGLAPTCTSIGYNVRECSNCGDIEYDFKDATGHSLDEGHIILAPKCEETGYKIYTCTVCNATEGEILAETGHDFVDNECTVCGELKLSEGIVYGTYGGGEYAGVQDIGTCTDKRIVIADTYKGLPVKIINYRAFENGNFTSVVLPETLTSIGQHVFRNCTQLESIVIPDSVTEVLDWAFYDCTNLRSVTIGKGLSYIGLQCFYHCSALENLYISDLAAYCAIDFQGGYASPMVYANNLYLNDNLIRDLVIPEGVTKIGCGAFENATCLNSVSFPSTLKQIISWAFDRCVNIESVYIDSISHWVGLYFSNVGSNPLYPNRSGKSSYLYVNGQPLTELVIPEGVTSIGQYAFEYDKLTKVTLPKSLTFVGRSAFGGCAKIEGVYISDLTAWCNIDFEGAGYSNPMFYATSNLYLNGELITDLVIPNEITAVKSNAFAGGTFTSLTLHDGITSIGEYAFLRCQNLTYVKIPEGVTEIGDEAFTGCQGLKEIIIPRSATTIGRSVFGACRSLEKVYYGGTEEQWRAINWGSGNNLILSIQAFFYSEENPFLNGATEGNFWHYENGEVVVWTKED